MTEVVFLDSSVLFNILGVPRKCSDRAEVVARFKEQAENGATFVFPMTAVAEWLWLTHTVRYDQLTDHLVVLDLWHPYEGFLPLPERDRMSHEHELVVPPRLFNGVLGSADVVIRLMGRSRFGSELMEGVVLRRDDGQRSKVLRPDFVRAGDADIGRSRNVLAPMP